MPTGKANNVACVVYNKPCLRGKQLRDLMRFVVSNTFYRHHTTRTRNDNRRFRKKVGCINIFQKSIYMHDQKQSKIYRLQHVVLRGKHWFLTYISSYFDYDNTYCMLIRSWKINGNTFTKSLLLATLFKKSNLIH